MMYGNVVCPLTSRIQARSEKFRWGGGRRQRSLNI